MSGKVYLVGIGPGDERRITSEARTVIKKCDLVIGQKDALKAIEPLLKGKEVNSAELSPVERSRLAVEAVQSGRAVALVSSGHPGIYAIASTFFSYVHERKLGVKAEVAAGLTLADYAAARLGSPIGSDFAAISLADQASPWKATKARLVAAAAADFVLVIYNPLGKLGARRLRQAVRLVLKHRSGGTPVGLLAGAGGPDERTQITSLWRLDPGQIGVDTLIIIGNSQSFVHAGRMVTPRLYKPHVGY